MKILKLTFNHNKLYFIGLILTVVCLPLSKFALSVSMIILICNWILELDFKRKWQALKSNYSILVFIGIFLVHLLWLFNTKNMNLAFQDLGNKAIILLYSIIIGTSKKLSSSQIKQIIIWFSLAVVTSTVISTLILVQLIDYPVQNIRDISPFISHIRLSLMINLSIFSLAYILFSKDYHTSKHEKIIYLVFITWLIVFLYLLKSLTGIVIFVILFFLVLAHISTKIKEIVPKLFLQVFLIALFLLLASFITHSISRFYSKEIVVTKELEEKTVNGNIYEHFLGKDQLENGNYISIYICEKELKSEWNKKSTIKYSDLDKKGQRLKNTLIRYLTSKGYRKDSVGISKLSDQDIKNIENGMANYIYQNKYALYPRIYDIIWQIDVYKKGYSPAGNSITLRLEFAKTAIDIIEKNLWFGVGTGDRNDVYKEQYELNKSKLPEKYRLRAHNMYLTFLLSFGILGSIVIWFSIFYPIFKLNGFRSYLFVIFILIALLSFINEDTLETQTGITFFSYFYSLFLFGRRENDLKN